MLRKILIRARGRAMPAGSASELLLGDIAAMAGMESRQMADICTTLAKGKYAADRDAVLELARMAQELDPKPWRRKWYGFELARSGHDQAACVVLHALDGAISFSNSEQRIYQKLKDEQGAKKEKGRDGKRDHARASNSNFASDGWHRVDGRPPVWRHAGDMGGRHFTVSGMTAGTLPEPTTKAMLLGIRFYDENGEPISSADVSGLSFSDRVGHYRYMTVGPQEQVFKIPFVAPQACRAMSLSFQPWHARNAALYVRDVTLEHHEAANDPSPSLSSARPSAPPSVEQGLKERASIAGWPEPESADGKNRPVFLAVMDEFTTDFFRHDVTLLRPRPDNWKALADKYTPDCVFIESAWQGNEGSWEYRIGSYAYKPGQELAELAGYARRNNIPVIFWNKEDPVHYSKFIESAALADVILTTDADVVPDYIRETGNDRVAALPFAAQPHLHRPAPLAGRKAVSCFAGSWYGERHRQRGQDMEWLLPAAAPLGLDIYDRNFERGIFPFPGHLQDHVAGSLPYRELCAQYGRYRTFLNVNSVTESPTMFSRRVFELLACGTPVVSTYSRGIESFFGDDIVTFVSNGDEAAAAIRALLHDEALWRDKSLRGIRAVFSAHTCRHRLATIMDMVGRGGRLRADPVLGLFGAVSSMAEYEHFARQAAAQTYARRKAVVFFDGAPEHMRLPPGDFTLVRAAMTESALRKWSGIVDYAGLLHPGASYAPTDFEDLVNATRYAGDAGLWARAASRAAEFGYDLPAAENAAIMPFGRFVPWAAAGARELPADVRRYVIQGE